MPPFGSYSPELGNFGGSSWSSQGFGQPQRSGGFSGYSRPQNIFQGSQGQNYQQQDFSGFSGQNQGSPQNSLGWASPLPPGGIYGAQGKWNNGSATDVFVRRGTPIFAPFDGVMSPDVSTPGPSPIGPVPGFTIRGRDGAMQVAHARMTAQGQVRRGQVIGYVDDQSMDMLGAYPGMPDGFQHADLRFSRSGQFNPFGGDMDGRQVLQAIGYQGRAVPGVTRGPNSAGMGGGGPMGMGSPFGGMGGGPFGGMPGMGMGMPGMGMGGGPPGMGGPFGGMGMGGMPGMGGPPGMGMGGPPPGMMGMMGGMGGSPFGGMGGGSPFGGMGFGGMGGMPPMPPMGMMGGMGMSPFSMMGPFGGRGFGR